MDLMKNLEKQAKDILKDEKKKEKAGNWYFKNKGKGRGR